VDDINLEDPIERIPMEVLRQKSQKVAKYALDLITSPSEPPPPYSKLLLLGEVGAGKTSLFQAFFPFKEKLATKGKHLVKPYWFQIQGNYLGKYDHEDCQKTHKEKPLIFLPEAQIRPLEEKRVLITNDKIRVEMVCDSTSQRDEWLHRLKNASKPTATQGVTISSERVAIPVVQQTLGEPLNLTVWDFSGMEGYRSIQPLFFTSRSVYLVVCDISKAEEGIEGLQFWLESLTARLPPLSTTTSSFSHPSYSIFVVGTFVDKLKQDSPEAKLQRKEKISELAKKCGLPVPVEYVELSVYNLGQIEKLKSDIFEKMMKHSYLKEPIPKPYMEVFKQVQEMKKKSLDITHLDQFQEKDTELLRRALHMISLWGEVLYFDTPPELASSVFLRPSEIIQETLCRIFSPALMKEIRTGFIKNSRLKLFWPGLSSTVPISELMKKFGVCFTPHSDKDLPLEEQRLVLPAFLPEISKEELERKWPPPSPFEPYVERYLVFNILPSSLYSRLIVRLNSKGMASSYWQNAVLLQCKDDILLHFYADTSNRFLKISCRRGFRDHCVKYLEETIQEISYFLSSFPGLKNKECVKSMFANKFVTIDECKKQLELPENQRSLSCPETGSKLDPEILLADAGVISAHEHGRFPLPLFFY